MQIGNAPLLTTHSTDMRYEDIQTAADRHYEEEWHKWYASLSYGERASLRAQKMNKPWVERKKFGSSQEARDEADLQDRLPELARHEITPHEVLAEREDAQKLDEEQVRQEIWNRHFHLFAMFMGTGIEQYDLLKMRSAVMLKHAAPDVLARYEGLGNVRAATASPMMVYKYIPLSDILNESAEEDELDAAAEMHLDVRAFRLLRFGEFCEEIAKRSRTLDQWTKNAMAWLRRTMPEEVAGLGLSQTAISRKFGEERATVSAREIRVVEEPLKAAGVRGHRLLGGTKGDGHRRKCAEAQKNNTNRKDGERRKWERESLR